MGDSRGKTGGGCLGEGIWGMRGCINRKLSKVRQKVRIGAGPPPPTHPPTSGKRGGGQEGARQVITTEGLPGGVFGTGATSLGGQDPAFPHPENTKRRQRNIKHLLCARCGSPDPNPNSSTSKLGDLGQEAATLCTSVSSEVMTLARGPGVL